MREIKFRAWDKDQKEMFYDKYDLGGFFKTVELLDLKVMQYTGLKDKNGVEIYEGDILIDWEYLSKYKVIWNNEWACFELECIRKVSDTSIEITDLSSSKVIGNIYQNPELLEK